MTESLLTKIAKAADPRYEPMPGDKVRVGRETRYVVERGRRGDCARHIHNHLEDHCVELYYLVHFQVQGDDGSFNPTHHSCPLLSWRTWARHGIEVND